MKVPDYKFAETTNQMHEEGGQPMPLSDLKQEDALATGSGEAKIEHTAGSVNLDHKDLATVELIQRSVAGLTFNINSALGTSALLTERGEAFVQRLRGSREEEQLQEYFLKMRQEYAKVATLAEMIAESTRLIVHQLTGIVDTE